MRRELVRFRTSREERVAAEVAGGTASLDLLSLTCSCLRPSYRSFSWTHLATGAPYSRD